MLQVRQPWETWPFMRGLPRLEVLYHSIPYLDMIRLIAGEPQGVYCRAVGHPALPEYSDPRSSIILDYGDRLRCSLTLNHTHVCGPKHRVSMFKVEGTTGAALLSMGVNLEYPLGLPDTMEIARDGEWIDPEWPCCDPRFGAHGRRYRGARAVARIDLDERTHPIRRGHRHK